MIGTPAYLPRMHDCPRDHELSCCGEW